MKTRYIACMSVLLLHLLSIPGGAAGVKYESISFNENDLVIQFSTTKFHRNDLAEAVKRGIEGKVIYSFEIVEDPALPLLKKKVLLRRRITRNVKYDFFKQAFVVYEGDIPHYLYNNDSFLSDLFYSHIFVLKDVKRYRDRDCYVRSRVEFTSMKLYFPINYIFEYIIGLWDFNTGWQDGPSLQSIDNDS
jgi:hypothetical protein